MKKNTGLFLAKCLPLLLSSALTACGFLGGKAPVFPIASDDRVSLTTEKGSPYESLGSVVLNPCTATYMGDGVGITAAHCTGKSIELAGMKKPSIGFRCASGRPGSDNCGTVAEITEIALPEGYVSAPDEESTSGFDIAFIRVKGEALPDSRFSLNDKFNMGPVTQAGYGMDRPGLTGDLSCQILPPLEQDSDFFKYQIRTDCVTVPGDSGSPLFNEQDNIIGVLKATAFDNNGKIAESYATPITPAIKEAFEQFRKGTLRGSATTLPNGVKMTVFPYNRAPVTY
jgi:V8-like Glu-specific endopeptidase